MYYNTEFNKTGVQSILNANDNSFLVQYCYTVPDSIKTMYMIEAMFQIYCNYKYHRFEKDYFENTFNRFFFWGHTILIDQNGELPEHQYSEYIKYWGLQLSSQQKGILNTVLLEQKKIELKQFIDLTHKEKDKPYEIIDSEFLQTQTLLPNVDNVLFLRNTGQCFSIDQEDIPFDFDPYSIFISKILTYTMKDNITHFIINKIINKKQNGKYNDFLSQVTTESIKQMVIDTISFFCTSQCFIIPYVNRDEYDLHKCIKQIYANLFNKQNNQELVNIIIDELKKIYMQLFNKGLIE